MLAVVKSKPEVGIEIITVLEPEIKKGHVMIEVKACGICGSDLHIYEWEPFIQWVKLPRVLGHEVAGIICEIGEDVEGFAPGDRIVADTWGGCGNCYFCRMGKFNHCLYQTRLGQHVDGGMAKYVIVLVGLSPETTLGPHIIVDKELSIHGSFRRLPSTWYRAINLVANKVVDIKPIISHALPLDRAEEGFQILLHKEGVKVILVPS